MIRDICGEKPRHITDLLRLAAKNYPERLAYSYLEDGKKWVKLFREFWNEVQFMAGVFRRLGISRNDGMAIILPVCPQWEIGHLACLLAQGVVVGIDAHGTTPHIEALLEKSQAQGLLVKDQSLLKELSKSTLSRFKFIVVLEKNGLAPVRRTIQMSTVIPAQAGVQAVDLFLKNVETLDPRFRGDDVLSIYFWDDLMAENTGEKVSYEGPEPNLEDTATIIFTSGSTGVRKGIQYKHQDLLIACQALLRVSPKFNQSSTISWLPLSNMYQRMIDLCSIANGSLIHFLSEPKRIMDEIKRVEPHFFVGVPRFYEKLYKGIMTQIGIKPKWQRTILHLALAWGDRNIRLMEKGKQPPVFHRILYALVDRLVLKKVRSILGSRIRVLFTGSSATPLHVLRFFHALGIPLLEGYALSENTIPIAMNRMGRFRLGTVGMVLEENSVRLALDNEILVKGPGLFHGYMGGESPSEFFTDNGYFKTGDCGEVDNDGFLKIIGRKSEIIKTSTGRKIAPAHVEEKFQSIPYIEHAVIFGEGKKGLVGLITLMPGHHPLANLLTVIRKRLREDINFVNQGLASHEQVWNWAILETPFSMDKEELTLNLKIRRNVIETRYAPILNELYGNLEKGSDLIIRHLSPL